MSSSSGYTHVGGGNTTVPGCNGLNALYPSAAPLPPRWHWRLNVRYCIEPLRAMVRLSNYTGALWVAMRCAYGGAAVTVTAMCMWGTASGGVNNERQGRSAHDGMVEWVQWSDAAPVMPLQNY